MKNGGVWWRQADRVERWRRRRRLCFGGACWPSVRCVAAGCCVPFLGHIRVTNLLIGASGRCWRVAFVAGGASGARGGGKNALLCRQVAFCLDGGAGVCAPPPPRSSSDVCARAVVASSPLPLHLTTLHPCSLASVIDIHLHSELLVLPACLLVPPAGRTTRATKGSRTASTMATTTVSDEALRERLMALLKQSDLSTTTGA